MIAFAIAAALLAGPSQAKEVGRVEAKDGLVLVFRASPVANLAYHLNCLAGIGSCTTKAYRDFWNGLDWSKEDEAAVSRWNALMNKYSKQVEFDAEAASSTVVPIPPEGVDLLERIRIAGYRAESWDDYSSGLALLMTADDARAALALTERFRARFDAWWKAEGRTQAETGAAGLRELVERKNLPEFYGKVARFYGYAYPKGTTVEFDIVAQPRSDAQHSNGEQIDDHSVVEFVFGEKPETKIDVVSHELFHYFYHSAPRVVRERLIAGFADAPEPYALAAYGLLNEAVATAFGQGLVARMVLPPAEFAKMLSEKDRLYAESEINDAAKALIEPLGACLERGVTIGQAGFVADYLDAVFAGLGPRLSSPQAWFRNVGLVYKQDLLAAKDHFQELTHPNSAWGYTFDESARQLFEQHAGLSGALFLKPQDVGELGSWQSVIGAKAFAEITKLARGAKPFVYGAKRSEKAYLYVFVGPNAEAVSKLVDSFVAASALFAGLRQ